MRLVVVIKCSNMGDQCNAISEIILVTKGSKPEITASIYFADGTFWFSANPGATTGNALRNMLNLAQTIVDYHINKSARGEVKHEVASPDNSDGARMSSADAFWSSDEVTNSRFHATGAFSLDRSDSFESLDSALGGSALEVTRSLNLVSEDTTGSEIEATYW